MYRLQVDKKTGYKIQDRNIPVIIKDWRGLPFYSTEGRTPRAKHFNLPALQEPYTTYIVESGEFVPLQSPVKYNLLSLPPAERKFRSPFDFEISFGDNPNKCTVSFTKGTIFFDNSFKSKTLPELYFVLFHEYAHQYFHTEKYTDVLASNYMLIKGFNPVQIGEAHVTSLSEKQVERKAFNIAKIIEANGQ